MYFYGKLAVILVDFEIFTRDFSYLLFYFIDTDIMYSPNN